jgi:hypothetical protein
VLEFHCATSTGVGGVALLSQYDRIGHVSKRFSKQGKASVILGLFLTHLNSSIDVTKSSSGTNGLFLKAVETSQRKVQRMLYVASVGQLWLGTRDGFVMVLSTDAPVRSSAR